MYRRLAIEQPAAVTEVPSPSTLARDSLMLSDDDEPDSEIERIINAQKTVKPKGQTKSVKIDDRVESPFAQAMNTEQAPTRPTRAPPSTAPSDSDDNDEFIAMLKRK